jgi:hypothetical protein
MGIALFEQEANMLKAMCGGNNSPPREAGVATAIPPAIPGELDCVVLEAEEDDEL